MPLPMAIGVIAMLVAAIVEMVRADLVLTLVGLVVFPAAVRHQRRSTSAGCRRGSRTRSRCAATVSAVAHESFDGALVVKSLGRETDETDRFRDVSRRAARRQHRGRPHPQHLRPAARGAAQPRHPRGHRCSASAAWPAARPTPATSCRWPTCSPSSAFPVRAIGWVLGELPAQRRRLGARRVGARRARRRWRTARRRSPGTGAGRRSTVARPDVQPSPTSPTATCCATSTFTRAGRHGRRGRRRAPAAARARSPRC